MQYYVYQLIDPQTEEIFYIGKGSGQRMYQHVKDAKHPTYCYRSVHRKIQSILTRGQSVKYNKIICESEQQAFELEQRLIQEVGRKDLKLGTLCNLTDGGEGSSNASPESIERRAAKHRGMKRSKESKLRMREAQLEIAERHRLLYNSGRSPKSRQKQSQSTKGRSWSELSRTTIRNKPTAILVKAFSVKGSESVKDFDSISEAAKHLRCSASEIWSIMVGRLVIGGKSKYVSKTAKGHRFLFYNPKTSTWQERIV